MIVLLCVVVCVFSLGVVGILPPANATDLPRSFLKAFIHNNHTMPAEWGWNCLRHVDLDSQETLEFGGGLASHYRGCLRCTDAKGWEAECKKIGNMETRTPTYGDFGSFGETRARLGQLIGFQMPPFIDYIILDRIKSHPGGAPIETCQNFPWHRDFPLRAPSFLNSRGFMFSALLDQDVLTFHRANFGELWVEFKTGLPGCPIYDMVKIRVNLGVYSTPGTDMNPAENALTPCYSLTPAFTVTCEYANRFLHCPITDALRSLEFMAKGDYFQVVLDFDTYCGKPEETDIIIPPLKDFNIFYLRPYVSNYFQNYITNMETITNMFPRCWFADEDTDIEFAGSWAGFQETNALLESSWQYGTLSEIQCAQMGGTMVSLQEFKKYYRCPTDAELEGCGTVDPIWYSALDRPASPPHNLRTYDVVHVGLEPY